MLPESSHKDGGKVSPASAYFPIGITPTKPLTPTHVKGLLHFDALTRLHRVVEPIQVVHNRRVWDLSLQTARFWTYLDRHHHQVDFSALSELQVGKLYVDFSREGTEVAIADLEAMLARIESQGYVHPSAWSVLYGWESHLRRIGLDTGILTESHALEVSTAAVLSTLSAFGELIDQRDFGGGVLWASRTGQGTTRTLISEMGIPNYVVALLRQIHTLTQGTETVHLFYDLSVERDFMLIEDYLKSFGLRVNRIGFPRMTSNGQSLSFRAGGGVVTLGEMMSRYDGDYSDRCIALGLRLYFLYMSGLRKSFDFSWERLDEALRMARTLLDTTASEHSPHPLPSSHFEWHSLRKNDGAMNVYKAYALLFEKKLPAEKRKALLEVLTA